MVHYLVTSLLSFAFTIPGIKKLTKKRFASNGQGVECFGIRFPSAVGLAAGFDKDAKMVDVLDAFGFGFIEVGTLTPKAQDGNPKPRLFRLPVDKAMINRMGFNNGGVEAAVARLKARKSQVIIGGNIGKNKDTPNDLAHEDYEICLDALYDVVDYFVVNISSPNTPDLRSLQEKGTPGKIAEEVNRSHGCPTTKKTDALEKLLRTCLQGRWMTLLTLCIAVALMD